MDPPIRNKNWTSRFNNQKINNLCKLCFWNTPSFENQHDSLQDWWTCSTLCFQIKGEGQFQNLEKLWGNLEKLWGCKKKLPITSRIVPKKPTHYTRKPNLGLGGSSSFFYKNPTKTLFTTLWTYAYTMLEIAWPQYIHRPKLNQVIGVREFWSSENASRRKVRG